MKISDFLIPACVTPDLKSSGKIDVLAELAELFSSAHSEISKEELTASLVERERLATTGFGNGAAIPHAKSASLQHIQGAFGISRTGIPFDSTDGKPVNFFFALFAPQGAANEHIMALGRISQLLRNSNFRKEVLQAKTGQEIFNIITKEDRKG